MNQEELLAARYGKKPVDRRRQRLAIVAIASVALIVFLTWAVSVTIAGAEKVEGTLASYNVKSDRLVEVKVNLKRPKNQAAVCQVEALAQDYEVVGYKELAIPENTDSVKSNIATVKPAVSAVVKDCWFK